MAIYILFQDYHFGFSDNVYFLHFSLFFVDFFLFISFRIWGFTSLTLFFFRDFKFFFHFLFCLFDSEIRHSIQFVTKNVSKSKFATHITSPLIRVSRANNFSTSFKHFLLLVVCPRKRVPFFLFSLYISETQIIGLKNAQIVS